MSARYSPRTFCPKCNSRIKLHDVRFTPTFRCPHCGTTVRVSRAYQRALDWAMWVPSLLILYELGLRWWLVLLCWMPLWAFLVGLWTYVGIYFIPPSIVDPDSDPKYPSILGLGPGPPPRGKDL
jgi:predicted RNA-binding Zn-ribbon protein involved in translation (DUF1610 family)